MDRLSILLASMTYRLRALLADMTYRRKAISIIISSPASGAEDYNNTYTRYTYFKLSLFLLQH